MIGEVGNPARGGQRQPGNYLCLPSPAKPLHRHQARGDTLYNVQDEDRLNLRGLPQIFFPPATISVRFSRFAASGGAVRRKGHGVRDLGSYEASYPGVDRATAITGFAFKCPALNPYMVRVI